MLKTTETDDEIIIREDFIIGYSGLWLNIVWGVVWLYSGGWTFFNPSFAALLWASLMLILFVWSWSKHQTITVRIEKKRQTISVSRRSLLKYDFEVYSFGQLEGPLFVETSKSVNQLMMSLKDGRRIELSARNGWWKKRFAAAEEAANHAIFNTPKTSLPPPTP
ncbi:MAG: hypothetical protein JSS81_17575 [Acidobacteria bacterium]|nr:hypothetical protein [Acidobacteriota bacterium]